MTDFTEKLTKKLKDETNSGEWFDNHVSVIKVDFSEDVVSYHNALAEDEATTAVNSPNIRNNACVPIGVDQWQAKNKRGMSN